MRNFKNVLLLSNLGSDCGREDFRLGTYTGTLHPLAARLAEEDGINVRLLANPYICGRLRKSGVLARGSKIRLTTYTGHDSDPEIMIRSYGAPLEKAEKHRFANNLRSALGDWRPDIILVWESPSDIFRAVFPESLVLDLTPSIFMRPPYPAMIAFDPHGIYGRSWLADADPEGSAARTTVSDLRTSFSAHFESLDIEERFRKLTGGTDLAAATLVPLQISSYFAWYDTSYFSTQTALMGATDAQVPGQSPLIFTQYTGTFVEERLIRQENIASWREAMPRLVYDTRFEGLDNFTQYLVPYTRNMVSVSSTLGLQAKLYGRPLLSPAVSHLKCVADSDQISDLARLNARNVDGLLEQYLERTCFLKDRLLTEPGYLADLLDRFKERRNQKDVDVFPDVAETGNTSETLLQHASLDRSRERFEGFARDALDDRVYPVATAAHATVSFDVFDTLVYRTVLTPPDVFVLMQGHMRRDMANTLPATLIDGFVALRQAAEKASSFALQDKGSGREEITIKEVYARLAADFALSPSQQVQLIALEQEMELAVLQPRPGGRRLYEQAQAQGQRIIIISDFIHGMDFVEKVLRNCGYGGWSALYVSSEVGLKKHSGALFAHVAQDARVVPEATLHVGDNPHGDVRMAQEAGWQARHLPSLPSRALGHCRDRPLSAPVMRKSVFLGAVLSCFAGCYLDDRGGGPGADAGLITTEEQLGFLTLGPPMYHFARWLLDEAKGTGCCQIMLFGRDTVLAHRILQDCFGEELRQKGISTCYIPISRNAAIGLDIYHVEDLWRVKFDDFDVRGSFKELLERRFMLLPEEIDLKALTQWTSAHIDTLRVCDLPNYAIYHVAMDSARRHWAAYAARLTRRQDVFREGLQQWSCDPTQRMLAVDLGYKGTLTRRVQGFFAEPLISRFFASYGDLRGSDPISNCKAFYADRLIPQIKDFEPFLNYNLAFETMVNESASSAAGYRMERGKVMPLREPNVDLKHTELVTHLHTGAMTFARTWHQKTKDFSHLIEVNPQALLHFFSEVMAHPTKAEARLLAPLVFDNAYSGHRPKRLIETDAQGRSSGGLWREGARRLDGVAGPAQSAVLRGVRLRVPQEWVRLGVKWTCKERLLQKFDRDPQAFFGDSKNPNVRRLGRDLVR
ncbi:MAG: HAD family hydrolase [Pseudomonadota bacterium]